MRATECPHTYLLPSPLSFCLSFRSCSLQSLQAAALLSLQPVFSMLLTRATCRMQ